MLSAVRIHLELEADARERLIAAAVAERRPISFQAEVLLRRALGLPDVAKPLAAEPPSKAAGA